MKYPYLYLLIFQTAIETETANAMNNVKTENVYREDKVIIYISINLASSALHWAGIDNELDTRLSLILCLACPVFLCINPILYREVEGSTWGRH